MDAVRTTVDGKRHEGLLGTPIESFREPVLTKSGEKHLSTRVLNALGLCRSHKIDTLGDLVVLDESQVRAIKNLGKKGLAEVKSLLESQGLELGSKVIW